MQVVDADKELRALGLAPGTWKDSLDAIKAGLSAADWDKFSRLHRGFVGYRSPETLSRFYGFVFSHDLHLQINRQRFSRLKGILTQLAEEIVAGESILDVGAGSGLIAGAVKRSLKPSAYWVQDPCAEVREYLAHQGFQVLPHPTPAVPEKPFDLLICADSLGEVNADDDGMLSETSELGATEFTTLMEERYGMVQKLDPWRPYLASGAKVLVWEPFKHNRAWEALAELFRAADWKTRLRSDPAGRPFLDLRMN